jgi:putative hydrolase of the HAD superfamily
MRFEAVLLDMDDTVLVHEKLADELWRDTVEVVLPDLAPSVHERVTAAIIEERHALWNHPQEAHIGRLDMHSARELFVGRAIQRVGEVAESPSTVEDLVREFSRARDSSVVFPETSREALLHFRSEGRKLALITNGGAESQRRKVDRFALSELVDTVLIEGEVGVGKPEWTIYDVALQSLDVRASEAVMIGDNWEWEVVIPRKHGLAAIWVRRFGEVAEADLEQRFLGTVRSLRETAVLISSFEQITNDPGDTQGR